MNVSGKGARNKGNNYERLLRQWDHPAWQVIEFEHKGHAEADLTVLVRGVKLSVEAKNHKNINLNFWWKQTQAQARNDEIPIMVHKRHGRTSADYQWVTMDMETFMELLGRVWWAAKEDEEQP